jgi:KaiC/GvpD/RAD55 family RecA-like ATPase
MAKKIMKVPIGIPVLDDKFSGIYVGHVTFLTGASGEGLEVAVGAALNNCFRIDEQVLAVFAESEDHIALRAREVGYDLEKATEIGALSTLYHSYKPGESLSVRESLEEIISEARRTSANVLFIQDARPWLEVHPVSAAPERVAEFVSTLEESGLTAIVALPEPVSAAAKKVWGEMKNRASAAIQFHRDRLGNYFMKVLAYIGLTANVPLPYETPLKFVPGKGFVKDAEPGTVPTPSGEFQAPAERNEAPSAAESFSHGANPVVMDMTQSILGQISRPAHAPRPDPAPPPAPAPAPEMSDFAKSPFAAAGTETKKYAKYSFASAMKVVG